MDMFSSVLTADMSFSLSALASRTQTSNIALQLRGLQNGHAGASVS